MGELTTYSLVDFVPVTADVYLRLFARQNENLWPLHFAAVALSLYVLYCTWTKTMRRSEYGPHYGLAAAWLFVGVTFHLKMYANLNWAAEYFGYAFLVQSFLLLVSDSANRSITDTATSSDGLIRYGGYSLALFALLVYPALPVLLSNRSWESVEFFGLAPAPTAMFSFGILMVQRKLWGLLLIIPALWCLYNGLENLALELYTGTSSLVVLGVGIGLLSWSFFRPRTQ